MVNSLFVLGICIQPTNHKFSLSGQSVSWIGAHVTKFLKENYLTYWFTECYRNDQVSLPGWLIWILANENPFIPKLLLCYHPLTEDSFCVRFDWLFRELGEFKFTKLSQKSYDSYPNWTLYVTCLFKSIKYNNITIDRVWSLQFAVTSYLEDYSRKDVSWAPKEVFVSGWFGRLGSSGVKILFFHP